MVKVKMFYKPNDNVKGWPDREINLATVPRVGEYISFSITDGPLYEVIDVVHHVDSYVDAVIFARASSARLGERR